jgi:sodium-independent sulfate anion transporter 11
MIKPDHPYPGIFIYRFSEGYNYPNANHYSDYLLQVIFQETQRTNPFTYPRPGDRPWNNPGPKKGKEQNPDDHRPHLKAVILDFSSVNFVDLTSVQNLIDLRNQLDRYTEPEKVQWHFACINNRWTKRALASAGFGFPSPDEDEFSRWKPIFSVAELGGVESAAAEAERRAHRNASVKGATDIETGQREVDNASGTGSSETNEIEKGIRESKAYSRGENTKVAVVQGLNRPFFHTDLTAALQSAIRNTESLKVKEDPVHVDEKQALKEQA